MIEGKKVPGSLILGGYDTTRFDPAGVSFQFSSDPERLLSLGVQSITSDSSLLGPYSMTEAGYLAVVDSTVSQLWLPDDVCDKFVKAFDLEYDRWTDLFLISDATHEKLLKLNPTFTLRLGNTAESTNQFVNIEIPYAAFDLQASYPMYRSAKNYFPIRRAKNENQYTLGRAFLQQAYLIVDYERGNFTVNQAVFPNPMPDPDIVTIYPSDYQPPSTDTGADSSSSSGSSSGGLSTGAIAGIAVAIAALALLAAVAAVLYLRRRRTRRQGEQIELPDNETNLPGGAHAKVQEIATSDVLGGRLPASPGDAPTHAYHYKPADAAHLSASELSGTPAPSELPSPLPVYEMEGDYIAPPKGSYRGPGGDSAASSPGLLVPGMTPSDEIRAANEAQARRSLLSRNAKWSEMKE
jgi:hypothetical protein